MVDSVPPIPPPFFSYMEVVFLFLMGFLGMRLRMLVLSIYYRYLSSLLLKDDCHILTHCCCPCCHRYIHRWWWGESKHNNFFKKLLVKGELNDTAYLPWCVLHEQTQTQFLQYLCLNFPIEAASLERSVASSDKFDLLFTNCKRFIFNLSICYIHSTLSSVRKVFSPIMSSRYNNLNSSQDISFYILLRLFIQLM